MGMRIGRSEIPAQAARAGTRNRTDWSGGCIWFGNTGGADRRETFDGSIEMGVVQQRVGPRTDRTAGRAFNNGKNAGVAGKKCRNKRGGDLVRTAKTPRKFFGSIDIFSRYFNIVRQNPSEPGLNFR